MLTKNTDHDITVLILFHLLSYTHSPIKPHVLVHNVHAWLVFYRCPSSLFCSLQLAANSHQEVMLFQVWVFWKRNVNHFDRFSTCLYHFAKPKCLNSIKIVSKGDFTLFLQNLSTFSPFLTVFCILAKLHLNPNRQQHYETNNLCHHHGRHLQHIHYIKTQLWKTMTLIHRLCSLTSLLSIQSFQNKCYNIAY